MSRTDDGPSLATATPPPGSGDDPRLTQALEEYLILIREGRRPRRDEFLARHAEVASALGECLAGLEFVQSAADGLPPPDVSGADDPIGATTVLGDFEILREVGRGGMGVVYEARQVSLGRRVALKVLPLASALDPRQRKRFQVEAQAAAHLHHTHIVPIFAVGCERGVHYYAMQFIDGRTLAEVIAELRCRRSKDGGPDVDRSTIDLAPPDSSPEPPQGRSTPTPTPNLTSTRNREHFRAIARLGVQAAEALEHAHSLGIVHRDVKPSNLMVDGRGDVWVTDFGLARLPGDSELTRTGDLLGTLRYMSPEQASARHGIVDERTDLYSLGVTLYELLALRPAFQGRDRADLLRQIAEDEPTPPRKVEPTIPRDLETVVLKAMAKEPDRRYGSAQELADDLRRFLDDQPIKARRPTALQHLAKWARRHRAILATAATVLVLAMAVGSILLWNSHRLTEMALEKYRKEYQGQRALARRSLELISQADQVAYYGMGRIAMLDEERARYYQMAEGLYEQITGLKFDTTRESRETVALAYHRLAFTRMLLKKVAVDDYTRAILEYEKLVEDYPGDDRLSLQLTQVMNEFGRYMTQYDGPLDFDVARRAELYLKRSIDMLKGIVARNPLPQACLDLTVSFVAYRKRLERNGRQAEAAQAREEMLGYFGGLADQAARDARLRAALPGVFQQMGFVLKQPSYSLQAEAVECYRRALRALPDDANMHNELAWYLALPRENPVQDPKLAVTHAEKGVELDAGNAYIWNTLGLARYRAGDLDGGEKAIRRSIELAAGVGEPGDWLILALILKAKGDPEEARRAYDQAYEVCKYQSQIAMQEDLKALDKEVAEALGIEARSAGPATPARVGA